MPGQSVSKNVSSQRMMKILLCFLLLLCVALIIAIAIVQQEKDEIEQDTPKSTKCSTSESLYAPNEPNNPSVFHDLTKTEIKGLKKFLYEESDLDLVRPTDNKINASFVYIAEVYVPEKAKVLNYLDNGGNQPAREAHLIIIRGTTSNSEINEIIVGPLPTPTSYRPYPGRRTSIPYFYRPLTEQDYDSVTEYLTDTVDRIAGNVLVNSFGAKLKDCGNKCLAFRYVSPFSPASSGENARKIWYWLTYFVEYYVLNPVDFSVLVNIREQSITIDKVWFNGKLYNSLEEIVSVFDTLNINATTFPVDDEQLFSTLNRRGPPITAKPKRNPLFVEPDSKRYTVTGQHVEYMGWSFDFRMSTMYGPQLYDIRFKGKRIVYELGLQEISVFYSGNSPHQRFSDFLDSGELIGPSAQGLLPGVDCPSHARFLRASFVTESTEEQDVVKNAFCIFELNTGEPLRRHHSYSAFDGMFYEGLENTVLVLRTILTIVNYDYIFDFKFFLNGAFETKAISTGYILATAFSAMEEKYGFQLQNRISGNYHAHMFHFKVDLDINGVQNRYQTLDLGVEKIHNVYSKDENATYSQGKITRTLVENEKDAAYKFNFDSPKYHIFFNNDVRDKYGNAKSYRILLKGITKQILLEGESTEPSISWSRYQMAVTRQRDEEPHSSSLYAMFDILDPVVNFQAFIDDNESIVDKDLVAWVTLGVHHIPHTEDLPLTTTAGMDLSFLLLPFNYFPEDPAIDSPNAVRIAPRAVNDISSGIKINTYGVSQESNFTCIPGKYNLFKHIEDDNSIIFEV